MSTRQLHSLLVGTAAGRSLELPQKEQGRLRLVSYAVANPVLALVAARSMAASGGGRPPVDRDTEPEDDGANLVELAEAAARVAMDAKQEATAAADRAEAAAREAGAASAEAEGAQKGSSSSREAATAAMEAAQTAASAAEAAAEAARAAAEEAQLIAAALGAVPDEGPSGAKTRASK